MLNEKLHPLSMDALLHEKFVEPEWAIEDWLIKGEPSLIVGEPKTFKSTLAMDMAVSLASGSPFMGEKEITGAAPVLYIQEENNRTVVVPQVWQLMERAGLGYMGKGEDEDGGLVPIWVPGAGAPEVPFFLNLRTGWTASKEGSDEVIEFCKKEGVKYIFIDPLYKVNPQGKFNNPDDVQPLLQELTRVENEIGDQAAIVLVHHSNKSRAGGGYQIMGSQLIWAWGANNVYLTKKARGGVKWIDVEREFRAKAEPERMWLRFNEGFEWEHEEMQFDTEGKTVTARKSEGKAAFLKWAQEFPDAYEDQTEAALAKAYGVSDRTIRNWKKEL